MRSSRTGDGCSPPGRTPCTGRRSSWSPRRRRWPPRSSPTSSARAFEAYLEQTKQATEIERQSTDRPKTGVFLGVHAINPVNGERIPVYAADYVLAEYGTGAIMAVPAHDQRDLDFARAFGLPVREVVATGGPDPQATGIATPGDGTYVNSGPLNGLTGQGERESRAIIARLEAEGAASRCGDLPAAGLAAEPPALLGLPDPDHPLRAMWGGAGAR